MRVISGNLKGKIIQNPTDKNTRPLRDMGWAKVVRV